MSSGDRAWPGLPTCLVMTACSVAAFFFWWVLVAPLGSQLLSLVVAMLGGRAAVALFASWQLAPPRAARLGLRLPRGRHWPALVLCAPSALLVLELQNLLFSVAGFEPLRGALEVSPLVLGLDRPGWIAPALLALVIVTPLSTELLFRGLMQPALVARHGRLLGVLVPALLASAAHAAVTAFGSPLGALVALAMLPWNLLFGWLRERLDSCLASALVRALGNAGLIALFALASKWPVPGLTAAGVHLPPLLLALSAASCCTGVLLLTRGKAASEEG